MSKRVILGVVAVVLVVSSAVYLLGGKKGKLVMNSESAGIGASGLSMQKRDMDYPSMAPTADSVYVSPTKADRMVIRSGSVSSLVKDVRSAVQSVSDYAKSEGGYVVSSYVSNDNDKPYGTVSFRIPVAKFDSAFSMLRSLGEVKNENVNGQDITEEYTDLESQLRNLRATETQLLELMRRSGTVGDILNVQRELTSIRGQIEVLTGRMKYLKDSVAMSNIVVHLSTDPENLPVLNDGGKTWKPLAVIKNAVRSLIGVFIGLGNFLIYVIIFIPVWLVLSLAVWGIYKHILHLKK